MSSGVRQTLYLKGGLRNPNPEILNKGKHHLFDYVVCSFHFILITTSSDQATSWHSHHQERGLDCHSELASATMRRWSLSLILCCLVHELGTFGFFKPDPDHQPLQDDQGVVLHDPDRLLERSSSTDQDEIIQLLKSFKLKMSSPHLGHWAVHAGLALVDATSSRRGELLSSRAQSFAKHMGFFDRRTLNVLVVMSAELGVELAGSLFDPSIGEKYFQESTDWLAAEVLCKTKLRAGRFAQAAQAAFDGILKVLTGSTELITSQSHFKQKELAKWKSSFQVGEIWLNMCGDRLCRELVLGDIRQLSEGFERYYHEAMTLPALNLLGEAKKRRVLILGGGDGGIATCALQFSTVEQVVNIDIDAMVTQHAKKWFPQVAAGFNDPRCEAMHTDAFAWVDRHSSSEAKFDLVVIDFTDEPLDGAWSEKFFAQLRGLLTTDGIVVQNAGTIANPQDLHKLFGLHALVFGSTFPMHALIPDYLGPYILVLSSADPKLQPLQADWGFWESQQVATQYYDGPAQHMALFNAIPTDVAQLLGLPLTSEHPTRVTLPLGPLGSSTSRKEKVLFKQKSTEGNLVKVTKETTESLYQEWDAILSSDSWHRDECLILPALSILGSPRSVLVLGGGTGALATLALRWPSVEKLRVVEVDELLTLCQESKRPAVPKGCFGGSK